MYYSLNRAKVPAIYRDANGGNLFPNQSGLVQIYRQYDKAEVVLEKETQREIKVGHSRSLKEMEVIELGGAELESCLQGRRANLHKDEATS